MHRVPREDGASHRRRSCRNHGVARAVIRTEITLTSPAKLALYQPYHEVMDLPWARATAAVQNAERAIEAAAAKGLKVLIEELRSRGIDVSCIGIVGAPERNLAAIGRRSNRKSSAGGKKT